MFLSEERQKLHCKLHGVWGFGDVGGVSLQGVGVYLDLGNAQNNGPYTAYIYPLFLENGPFLWALLEVQVGCNGRGSG